MKLAVMISNLRFGGAEVQTVELVNNLSARGDEVLLISMDQDLAIKERVASGIEIVVLGKRSYVDFRILIRLVRLLRKYRPECFIMVNSYPALYGYLASFFSGRSFKMIDIQHTTLFKGFADTLQNLYYMRILNRMDRIVFVSEKQMNHWITNYRINPQKASVIYNGIELSRFEGYQADVAAIRAELGFKPEDIVIGINANLRPEKKHEDMIEALQNLISQGYPVKLLLIGDGIRRSFLEKFAEEKGVAKHVYITGFVQDVRPYLSIVDIAALTSVAVETLSIAIIESMALAKPVVLSDIGGAGELVENGRNGFLYEAGNIGQLTEALKKIIDGGLFDSMGKVSFEKAKVLFDTVTMVDKYDGLLKNGSY